jgi:hypothetical protein
VDALLLELGGGLDTLPGRGDLDEDTVLLDADRLVEVNELVRLLDGSGLVERVLGVDLGRDTARDDLEDLLAELDEERVDGKVNLGLDVTRLLLAGGNGGVDQLGVGGELGCGKDEGGVGGSVLGLVGGD